jgi:hypothetical protein
MMVMGFILTAIFPTKILRVVRSFIFATTVQGYPGMVWYRMTIFSFYKQTAALQFLFAIVLTYNYTDGACIKGNGKNNMKESKRQFALLSV